MSSDGYFDDESFDDAALAQLDAIEAAYTITSNNVEVNGAQHPKAITPATVSNSGSTSKAQNPRPLGKDVSFYDLTLDLDDEELEKLDSFIADAYTEKPKSTIGPTRQTTLFGDVLPNNPPAGSSKPTSRQGFQRTTSSSRNIFGSKPKKTKVWDQTAFAQTGRKQKGKGKFFNDEEEPEEPLEFEQFPAPFIPPNEPPPPIKLKPDLLETKHWIFPLNKPKRDYQFNIVNHSLFENTIISVPTGLGKTFIAGVIMLNYYRWFPDGKVIFVAPTKPLVAQQIEASHQSCGIPGDDAAEMTGEIPKAKRERLWREKRVFYMTPQTLMNDLVTQNCDVMDIILLIVDEAHKATGDYAYNQIVRYMMAKNPHFRLIALTATPGSDPSAVQNLVDGLHISHIEIRDENSLDLRPYLHEKKIEQHCIRMTDGIVRIRDLLAQVMDTFLTPLKTRGIFWPEQQAVKIHPYGARVKMKALTRGQMGFLGPLSTLANLAQAMGYLLEGTTGMAFSYLTDISHRDTDEHASNNQQSQSKKLRELDSFKRTMAAFEAYRDMTTGFFPPHPKMDKTVDILVKYYGQRLPDSDQEDGEGAGAEESKAMVFVTHREAVDEIVKTLNEHSPMIRASKFIGQGTDKHGNRGQAQKEQLEIIQKFQNNEFNVLVATCIGEEGLDIGEVDLIICYDTQKTPIRMLQRFGRTGRKRKGCVHVLLAEDREEFNLDKARASYKEVQKAICRGDDLEFYADVERLLPDHIKPVCLEKVMEIRPYVREERKTKRSPTKSSTTTKRKRIDDMMRNIPPGASTGFVSASALTVKSSKKRKVSEERDLEAEGEDDDIDRRLEGGVGALLTYKRSQSLTSAPRKDPWEEDDSEKPKPKGKMKRATTTLPESAPKTKTKSKKREKEKDKKEEGKEKGTGKGKGKGKSKKKEPTPSLSQQGRDDSVDRELEEGPFKNWKKIKRTPIVSLSPSPQPPAKLNKTRLSPLEEDDPIDLLGVVTEQCQPNTPLAQEGCRLQNQSTEDSMAWLVDDDDEPDIVILSSSPTMPKVANFDESVEFVGFAPSNIRNQGSGISNGSKSGTQPLHDEVLELSSEPDTTPRTRSPGASAESKAKKAMPPPCRIPSPNQTRSLPRTPIIENTQPVRRIGGYALKRRLPQADASSDTEVPPPPSQRRLYRYQDSPKANQHKKRKTKTKPLTKRKHNPLLDYAAEHSGDEVSTGSSNSGEDSESESDRLFIKDSPITQVSPSYDQTDAYHTSLMTQIPGGYSGPVFAHGPLRNRPFGRMEPRVRRRVVDSSPPPEDDDYEFGSFVIADDAEVSYLTQVDDSLL